MAKARAILSEREQTIIQNYNPEQGLTENARRISNKTGFNFYTCRCYVYALERGVSFSEYGNRGERERNKFTPTDPCEVTSICDNQISISHDWDFLTEPEKQEMAAKLQEAIETLPRLDRNVLTAYFFDGKKQKDIAREKNTHQSKISHRIKRILEKLLFRAKARGLEIYLVN